MGIKQSTEIFTKIELQRIWSSRPRPDLALLPGKRCSAVAMLFNEQAGQLNLCVGRRAQFPGDPWSGDMAFPGGKAEPHDQNFHDIASREAQEEIGLDLSSLIPIGALDILQTHGSASRPPLFVRPVIYILPGQPAPFRLNDELEAAFWIPVGHIWDSSNRDALHWGEPARAYPGVRYGEDIIWGFTYRMLSEFGRAIGKEL